MRKKLDGAPAQTDRSGPSGPMDLEDWVALYPTLPRRTISMCLWEANTKATSQDSDEDRNMVVAWLVSARLEELRHSAHDASSQPDDVIALPELVERLAQSDP